MNLIKQCQVNYLIISQFDGAGNLFPGKTGGTFSECEFPGAQGGDSHQTEDGLVFLREHFGTCMTWVAWCSQLKSRTRMKIVSAARAALGTISPKHLLLCQPAGLKVKGKKMALQNLLTPHGFTTF